MAIQVRGTTDGSDSGGAGFSIAPPTGVQVGDLLILLKQETLEAGDVSGWTNIAPSSPAIFDNGEDGLCAYRYHDGSSTYVIAPPGGGVVTVSMIAIYSDVDWTLVIDDATCALTEVEKSGVSNVVWDLQSVTTAEDDSLLVALIGLIAADETPATPSGGVTVEDSGADSGVTSGGFKIITEARATAGATGSRAIETLRSGGGSNAGNAVAGAFAVSEVAPTEADLTATATVTALATVTSGDSLQVVETAMGDYALVWGDGAANLILEDDDLKSDQGMRTALLLSLFLDRLAHEDDELPAADGDRRGWWADEFSEVKGDLIGSRNWLLDRAKLTPDTVAKAKEYDEEATSWLVDDGIVERIVNTPRIERGVLWHLVDVFRPDGSIVNFRFAHIWPAEELAAKEQP